MITDRNARFRLLDDDYYNGLVKVLSTEDEAERRESWMLRRKMKEEREVAVWWLEKMQKKAYREYMAQKAQS